MAVEPHRENIEKLIKQLLEERTMSPADEKILHLANGMMNLKILEELDALRDEFAKVNKRLDTLEERLAAQNENKVHKVKIDANKPK
jgi:predicted  nucleic acid-binding Zn-ribbon protein